MRRRANRPERARACRAARGEPPGGERGAESELRARIDLMADEPRLLGRARCRDAPSLRVENVLLRGKTVAGLEQSETGGRRAERSGDVESVSRLGPPAHKRLLP